MGPGVRGHRLCALGAKHLASLCLGPPPPEMGLMTAVAPRADVAARRGAEAEPPEA